jgi:hypothetical protein
MRLHALYLTGALIATALPSRRERYPFGRITRQSPTLYKPGRLHTLALPVITGRRTAMPRMASLGRRIAQCAGE